MVEKVSINKAIGNEGRHEKELKPSQKSTSRGSLQKTAPYYLALFGSLITLAIYLPALGNDFVLWDDDMYVITNLHIRSLNWAFFKWAFSGFYASNWHPLTWVSHAIDYAAWGLNPLGHHLTNIMLHSVNTFLVVLLCMELLEMWKERSMPDEASTFLDERRIMIAAGVTGLLFGLHPLHVESVAWVAERKDLLCGLFFLLSISAYGNHIHSLGNRPIEEKKAASLFFNRCYLVSLAFFVLALLSKPMAVSLPVVLLMLDWYPFQRIRSLKSFRDSFVEKLPFIVLSLISSILTIMAQRTEGAMAIMAFVPLWVRMLVAAKAFVTYLVHIVAPVGLSSFYPYPKWQEVTLLSPKYLFAVIFVGGITAILFVATKKQRLWLSAWGYYVVTLIPVIGIVQVGDQSIADRYTYLPSLGPFLLIGLIAAWVWAKASSLKQWSPMVKSFTTALSISVVISLSYATLKQIAVWRDNLTLWKDTVKKSPDSERAHNNLGLAYASKGQVERAIAEYQTALRLKPDLAGAHCNLGNAYASQGQLEAAIAEYQTALRLKPDSEVTHYNIGNAYLSQGQVERAIAEYQTALRLKPDYAEAHNNLAIAYKSQGQLEKAIAEYQTALQLKPDNAEAHNNLAIAYKSQGQLEKAIAEYQTALQLKPDYAEAHNNLGLAYASKGLLDMAIEQYRTALSLKPDYAVAHFNLGVSYLDKGFKDMARREFELELTIKPDDYMARQFLNSIISK